MYYHYLLSHYSIIINTLPLTYPHTFPGRLVPVGLVGAGLAEIEIENLDQMLC